VTAVAGPDRLTLSTPAAVHGENLRTIAEFDIGAGQEIPFSHLVSLLPGGPGSGRRLR
jgi:hypothetical protein